MVASEWACLGATFGPKSAVRACQVRRPDKAAMESVLEACAITGARSVSAGPEMHGRGFGRDQKSIAMPFFSQSP
jgi:hypothetical protein